MINIQNLSFHYKKKSPLFNNFSLEVESGRIVGLLGKNGAGKSTLLHLISGLIQPKAGKINVNGFVPFDRNPIIWRTYTWFPKNSRFLLSAFPPM